MKRSAKQMKSDIDRALAKPDPVLTIAEASKLAAEHGVSRSEFWQEAMGGDMAPMERSTAMRIIRGLRR